MVFWEYVLVVCCIEEFVNYFGWLFFVYVVKFRILNFLFFGILNNGDLFDIMVDFIKGLMD